MHAPFFNTEAQVLLACFLAYLLANLLKLGGALGFSLGLLLALDLLAFDLDILAHLLAVILADVLADTGLGHRQALSLAEGDLGQQHRGADLGAHGLAHRVTLLHGVHELHRIALRELHGYFLALFALDKFALVLAVVYAFLLLGDGDLWQLEALWLGSSGSCAICEEGEGHKGAAGEHLHIHT
jgi:hypothetical protein